MALTKLTENLNVISQLSDEPTQSATELKAKFDYAGLSIKEYINDTLTEQLDEAIAAIPQIANDLVTNSSVKALSAAAGKSLNDTLGARLSACESSVTQLDTAVDTKQKSISVSSSAPSGGSNGDIHLRYV